MRKTTASTLVKLLLITVLVAPVHAQWLQTAGPEGGYPMSFVSAGSTIYAGSFAGGVFKSTNNGDSWVWSGSGLPVGTQVRSLAYDGSNMYAGTSSGVYKSTDQGNSWFLSNTGFTNNNINTVHVFGGSLFAGTVSAGIFLSTNQGANWAIDTVGLSSLAVRCFASNGSAVFAGTGGGVFRSTNNGGTWSQVNSGLSNTNVNTLGIVGGVLLAGTQSGGVFRSTNEGGTWSGGGFDITLALAVIGSDAFQATLAGVMRSTDLGATWNPANTGIPPTNNTRSLGVLGSTLFVGMGNNGDRAGVYRSTDLGGSWVEKNTGYINTLVNAFLVNGGTLFAGNSDGALYRTTNNGTVWTPIKNFGAGVFSLLLNGADMLLGTGTSAGGVHRSTDGGSTWTFSGTGLAFSGDVRALAVSGTSILAGISQSSGVYRSTNGGTNWSASNAGLTNTTVSALLVAGANVLAGTNGGVFISTNGGQNWAVSNAGLTSLVVQTLASNGSLIFAGTSNGFFISTNGGTNWAVSNSGLTGTNVRSLVASASSVVAGTSLGVFVSTNSGGNWAAANTGLFNTSILSLHLSGSDLMAGTGGNGAWRRPFSQLTGVEEMTGMPDAFTLGQNYPNPFNPSTRIRFSIQRSGLTSLKVYDVLGREVAALVDEYLRGGNYVTTFDASRFATGVYYYKLSNGNLSETKRMIFMK